MIAGAVGGLVLAAPVNHAALARQRKAPLARGAFAHGISSGMPKPEGAVLWTRVSDLERRSRLTLEVAKDPGFRKVVKTKEVIADPRVDFTVRHRVGGLEPGREYYYRFATKNSDSPVGRSAPCRRRTRRIRSGSPSSPARATPRVSIPRTRHWPPSRTSIS